MKFSFHSLLVALACGLATTGTRAASPENLRASSLRGLADAPLYFEANRGQAEAGAKFIARGRDSAVLISFTEASLLFEKSGAAKTIRFSLNGAAAGAKISGVGGLPGRANYFVGNDPSEWRPGVPLFSRVRVEKVYPGIDLIYYADQSARLEYDFMLQPGADPKQISLQISGADKLRVNAGGDLVLKMGREEICQHKPVIYQTVNGVRKEIQGGYRLAGKTTAGFWIGDYDRALPLVIDPVLSFSTYLGGKYGDAGWDITTDTSGNVYVCGDTFSPDLRTNIISGAARTNYGGTQGTKQYGDAFVAKFFPTASNTLALSYLTYLGGKGQESARGIAADSGGNAYVTGFTDSPNFPIVPTNTAAFPKISGRNNNAQGIYRVDAFVTKISPDGSSLIYSTYLGGGERDAGNAIAVDGLGYAYIAGFTESTNFPVGNNVTFANTNFFATATNVAQRRFGGVQDAFVAKVDTDGTRLIYSTLLGGTNVDNADGIKVDSTGNAYVTGYTLSTNFPTVPANNSHLNGLTNKQAILYYDGFFTKISTDGSSNVFSTFLGGENTDVPLRLALDSAGTGDSAYITGYTFSTNFPVTTVITNTRTWANLNTNLFADIFVTKFSLLPDGSYTTNAPGYSVVFGGRTTDEATGIAVDSAGDAILTGYTSSTNLFDIYIVTNFYVYKTNKSHSIITIITNSVTLTNFDTGMTILDSSGSTTNKFKTATNNVFVAVLNPEASAFNYAALFGGSGNDIAHGIALDLNRTNVYIVGSTTSSNFPARLSIRSRPGGKQNSNDVFIATINLASSFPIIQKRTLAITASPTLFITQSNGIVTLAWPVVGVNFVLESNPTLSPDGWTTVAQEPVLSGDWQSVTLPATSSSGFFRLRCP